MVDLDEGALTAAQEHLGTKTIKETVNAALNLATGRALSGEQIDAALEIWSTMDLSDQDREEMWR